MPQNCGSHSGAGSEDLRVFEEQGVICSWTFFLIGWREASRSQYYQPSGCNGSEVYSACHQHIFLLSFKMMGYWNVWVIYQLLVWRTYFFTPSHPPGPKLCHEIFLHFPFLKGQHWDKCLGQWTQFKYVPYCSVRKFSSLWACFYLVTKKETAPLFSPFSPSKLLFKAQFNHPLLLFSC